MDGWNTIYLLGWPISRCYVCFREDTHVSNFFSEALELGQTSNRWVEPDALRSRLRADFFSRETHYGKKGNDQINTLGESGVYIYIYICMCVCCNIYIIYIYIHIILSIAMSVYLQIYIQNNTYIYIYLCIYLFVFFLYSVYRWIPSKISPITLQPKAFFCLSVSPPKNSAKILPFTRPTRPVHVPRKMSLPRRTALADPPVISNDPRYIQTIPSSVGCWWIFFDNKNICWLKHVWNCAVLG